MLKKHISMKRLILLIFLNFIGLNAQEKFEGKYCVDYKIKDISKCIVFKNNKKFTVFSSGHIGNHPKLSGRWTYSNRHLI